MGSLTRSFRVRTYEDVAFITIGLDRQGTGSPHEIIDGWLIGGELTTLFDGQD